MPPAGLSQTETVVWNWLLDEKGYDAEEIVRRGRSQTPSFICPDESYEVKRPYSKQKILVSENQAATLTEIDPMIVVAHEYADAPQATFRWSDRDGANYAVHIHGQPTKLTLTLPDDVKQKWDQMVAAMGADMDDADVIERVVDVYDTHPSFFEDNYR